ncbi:signal recognition particle SRP14 subunit [Penicillium lagena]|uniref:signal recognition particle SRP14 subunit n=1 Tax=Penicillium lagena TaxID=94218 RepID=UPI00253FAC09|nr:signal recognition particle SRP14 subunit [Penicillium lagena]KAJ5624060.1 signal recognition particle SRP14 subunit [Penicillium lagena]
MAPHLSHNEFFSSLTDLLSKTSQKSRGSVYLTQKPMTDADSSNSQPSILIRATDGNTNAPNPKSGKSGKSSRVTKDKSTKVKMSTIVSPGDLESFYTRYAEVCKTGMAGLKKRDRSKRKGKAKAKGGASKTTEA